MKALISLYPELRLNEMKFPNVPRMWHISIIILIILISGGYWQERVNRRRFFDTFASSFDFNPLSREAWKQVLLSHITSHKVDIQYER